MVDIVIPLGNGSKHDNIELRYTLRSIEKHLSHVRRVIIVTDQMPAWINLNTVTHLAVEPEKDHYRYLTRNIHQKIDAACREYNVTDQFLYMNDDHFLIWAFEADKFPLLHDGYNWQIGTGKYNVTIENTLKYIGPPKTFNYDIHAPMLMYKQDYLAYVSTLDWKKHFGYCIKTMYQYGCWLNSLEYSAGTRYPDLKINEPLCYRDILNTVQDRFFFSIGDKALTQGMKDVLNLYYPNKSKYEL